MNLRPLLVCSAILALGADLGCARRYDWQPADVVLIRSSAAPNGRHSAILLRHISRAALSGDTYKVLVSVHPLPRSSEALARLANSTTAVLHATNADRVQMRWASDTTLVVVCAACGVEQIDIMERRDRVGAVRARFEGFPRGTAYDLSEAEIDSMAQSDAAKYGSYARSESPRR